MQKPVHLTSLTETNNFITKARTNIGATIYLTAMSLTYPIPVVTVIQDSAMHNLFFRSIVKSGHEEICKLFGFYTKMNPSAEWLIQS